VTETPCPRLVLPAAASIPYGTIDAEHEALVALLNRLCEQAEATRFSGAVLDPLYQELRTGLADHFAHEERAMEETGFPGLARHRAHHIDLMARVVDICERSRKGYFADSRELLGFFDIIIDEVLRADLPFKTHLEQNGLC
jgi:hemerythrin-like metal-binding protein